MTAAILLAGVLWSLTLGARPIGPSTVLSAIFSYDGSAAHNIVRVIRLPRALLAVLVGVDMAVAGTILQAITRNPIASPEVIGVSAGAAVVVTLNATFFPFLFGPWTVALAFLGGAVTAVVVLVLAGAGQGRTNPVRLALAGMTVYFLLLSVTQGLIIFHENSAQAVFFWLVGGVNFGQWKDVVTLLPWTGLGLIGAFALASALNVLALGDDVARGLGQDVNRTRLLGAACAVVLIGAAVAVAGPIAFLGLIVPHIARRLVGSNHFLVFPLAGLVGAAVLVLADGISRFVYPPYETPAGIITALVGAPFFVYLARRQRPGAA